VSAEKIQELRSKNGRLVQLVILLSRVLLSSVAEQRQLWQFRGSDSDRLQFQPIAAVQTIAQLRMAAAHCAQLARDCGDRDAARTLVQLGRDLEDEGQRLEAVFQIRRE
jgi:hypothetical protein